MLLGRSPPALTSVCIQSEQQDRQRLLPPVAQLGAAAEREKKRREGMWYWRRAE